MSDEVVLLEGRFDPRVKTYWFLQGIALHLGLLFAIVGVVTLPVWMLGGGQWLSRRRYELLSTSLTRRAVHLRTGGLVRVEKTVPLDQIQDVSLRSGPLLDRLGLASVRIETAGQSSSDGSDMVLPGLMDARAFRDAVLRQRDALADGETPAAGQSDEEVAPLLREIRDVLLRLERRLPPEA